MDRIWHILQIMHEAKFSIQFLLLLIYLEESVYNTFITCKNTKVQSIKFDEIGDETMYVCPLLVAVKISD